MSPFPAWDEREWVPISALEHFSYCPRQCALIHVEQTYDENIYTLRGRAAHKRADEPLSRQEEGVRVERALSLWSSQYGLVGRADVVEFHLAGPYPVEYKQGPRRQHEHDDVQLCAQALCLEEMFQCTVSAGAVFHVSSRHRREVLLDESLRLHTLQVIEAVRKLLVTLSVPPPVHDARCKNCSLLDSCLPSALTDRGRVRELHRRMLDIEP